MRVLIDINCDLGEGVGIEANIMPYISSANIACAEHAGDERTIQTTIQLAKEFNVAIGAHPSYPDRENFGRVVMPIDLQTLTQSVVKQIYKVSEIAKQENYPIGHIKFHGALYNEAAKNKLLAEELVKTIVKIDSSLLLYGPPASELQNAALHYQLSYCQEGFIDRTYQDDGSLTPRSHLQALITSESKSIQQALQMIRQQTVTTLTGKIIPLPVRTLCIHGDGPNALHFAKALQEALIRENINIQPAYDRTT
jgi:UPF0271 protein